MTVDRPKNKLGSWLRRHSLTLVAALGGAVGVAYAAGVHTSTSSASTAPAGAIAVVATPQVEVRDEVQDTVQIALVLDTSGSMDGLINQARSHLWKMVDDMGKMTRVVNGKTRGVKVELALYEYGNDTIDAKVGHIRQVLPLTEDLDSVSEKLHGLFTNGGSEYAGQAIETAVKSLQWSSDPDAMKFIFVAGNEGFDQGPITAEVAMAAAATKDINVQLIYCGVKDGTWDAAAKLAKSDLMTIDQNHVAQHIAAPQDDEILRLGQELNNTYMAFGAEGRVASQRQARADASSAKMSKKVAIERATLKSKKAYKNAKWDLVDAVETDPNALAKVKDEQLPEVMRGKTLAEKQAMLAANSAKRAEIKAKIAKLEADRSSFVQAEQAKTGADTTQSLETELYKSTKKAAAKKGYK